MSMPQRPMVSTSSRSVPPDSLSGATASVTLVVAVVAVVTVIASPHPWGPQVSRNKACAGRHCEACLTARLQVKHLSEHLTSGNRETGRDVHAGRHPHSPHANRHSGHGDPRHHDAHDNDSA